MIQANSIRELRMVRDKLEAMQQENRNLAANYGALIEQVEDVIEDLTDHIWDN